MEVIKPGDVRWLRPNCNIYRSTLLGDGSIVCDPVNDHVFLVIISIKPLLAAKGWTDVDRHDDELFFLVVADGTFGWVFAEDTDEMP
jgi:hypothetical protein